MIQINSDFKLGRGKIYIISKCVHRSKLEENR
jgi:hypothetical protein